MNAPGRRAAFLVNSPATTAIFGAMNQCASNAIFYFNAEDVRSAAADFEQFCIGTGLVEAGCLKDERAFCEWLVVRLRSAIHKELRSCK
jgi:hypothetical protein